MGDALAMGAATRAVVATMLAVAMCVFVFTATLESEEIMQEAQDTFAQQEADLLKEAKVVRDMPDGAEKDAKKEDLMARARDLHMMEQGAAQHAADHPEEASTDEPTEPVEVEDSTKPHSKTPSDDKKQPSTLSETTVKSETRTKVQDKSVCRCIGDKVGSRGLLLSKLTQKECEKEGQQMGRTGCLLQGPDDAPPTPKAPANTKEQVMQETDRNLKAAKTGAKPPVKQLAEKMCICDGEDKNKVALFVNEKDLYMEGDRACIVEGKKQGYDSCKLTEHASGHISLTMHTFEPAANAAPPPKITKAQKKAMAEASEKDEIRRLDQERKAQIKENAHKKAFWNKLTDNYAHKDDKKMEKKAKQHAKHQKAWAQESQKQQEMWTRNAGLRVQAGLLATTKAIKEEQAHEKAEKKAQAEEAAAALKEKKDMEVNAKALLKVRHEKLKKERLAYEQNEADKQAQRKREKLEEQYRKNHEKKDRKSAQMRQNAKVKAAQQQVERMNKKLAKEEAQRQQAAQMTEKEQIQQSSPEEQKKLANLQATVRMQAIAHQLDKESKTKFHDDDSIVVKKSAPARHAVPGLQKIKKVLQTMKPLPSVVTKSAPVKSVVTKSAKSAPVVAQTPTHEQAAIQAAHDLKVKARGDQMLKAEMADRGERARENAYLKMKVKSVVTKSAPLKPVAKKAEKNAEANPVAKAKAKPFHDLTPEQQYAFDKLEGNKEKLYEDKYGPHPFGKNKGQVMQETESKPPSAKPPSAKPPSAKPPSAKPPSAKSPSAKHGIGGLTAEQGRTYDKMNAGDTVWGKDANKDTKQLAQQNQEDQDACADDCANVAAQQALEAKTAKAGPPGPPSALLQALIAKLGSCDCEAMGPASKPKNLWRSVASAELLEEPEPIKSEPTKSEGYDLSLWNSA